MVVHICPNCNKVFNKKSTYDYHIKNKKNPCVNNNVYMSVNNNNNNILITHKTTQFNTQNINNPLNNPHNLYNNIDTNNFNKSEIKKINNINKYQCSYCDLVCSRSDSLNRHIEKYCKNKKHIENMDVIQSKIKDTITITNEKYEKLEEDNLKLHKDNKMLIEILEEYKHFIKENNLLKQSIPSVNNGSVINGNVNNGAVNNGTVNNNNTTINHIVQFGKEDISKCDLIEMMNIYLKSTGGNIFANILKYLNFNPNFPENFNIFMGDLARENVKIHNGKKFITKKFKNVKGDILNSLSSHITTMCDTYVEDPKTKKNDDILGKIKINNISVKLINNDDITPLLTIKKEKNIKNKNIITDDNDLDSNTENSSVNSDESDEYLDLEGEKKLVHYENKRHGLQEITTQKLKDELYNNKALVEKHHKLIEI